MSTDDDGLSRPIALVRQAYNRIVRPRLPRSEISVWAGVPVRDTPVLDRTRVHDGYKAGFLSAISEVVQDGDRVALVGFGRGVSTVYALRAGADHVVAYEGAAEMVDVGSETLRMVGRRDDVTVRHAVVGEAVDLYGDGSEAEVVPPSAIADADVLVLDCEGAELSILSGIDSPPARVVVETHPNKGASDAAVRELLDRAGYALETRAYEPNRPDKTVFVGRSSSA